MGFVAFLVLQTHYVMAWHNYYSQFPHRGYERATAAGMVPPFITATKQTRLVGNWVLFTLGLVTLLSVPTTRGKAKAAMALWFGVMIGVVVVWIGVAQLRNDSNMWPIDFLILALITGIPILIGSLLHVLLIQLNSAFTMIRS